MIRVFIAINLPADLQRKLEQLQGELSKALPPGGVRWTQAEQIHLTLRFLGHVAEASLPELEDALRRACARSGPFDLRAEGLGCFPSPRRPRIVWVGIAGALDKLRGLLDAIERETESWGEREERESHPHLTVGRVKVTSPALSRALEAKLSGPVSLGQWRVGQVDLMRSDLSPQGPRYSRLAAVALIASAGAPA
jgi:2'-5' RNA ligase